MQLCCTRGKSRARSIARFCLQYQRNGSSRSFLCKYMYKDTEREGARQSKQVKSHRLVHFSFWFLLLLYPLLITLWSQGVNQGINCTHLLLSFFFFRLYHEREGKREKERGGRALISRFKGPRVSRGLFPLILDVTRPLAFYTSFLWSEGKDFGRLVCIPRPLITR